jgi:predicted CXXCH cytochrome family protein
MMSAARWTRSGIAAALALALLALRAGATDAPHDGSSNPGINTGNCSDCHSLHGAVGRALTNQPDTFSLCSSCHNKVAPGGRLGFPWYTQSEAVPGSGGTQHRWDASATSLGARVPADPAHAGLAAVVARNGGVLSCSVCHDQHLASQASAPGSQHTSQPVGAGSFNKDAGFGTGSLTLAAVGAGAASRGYLVEVAGQGTNATATFHLSHDNGRSWFRCAAATTYSYVAEPAGVPCQAGASVPLDDATVKITFNAGGAGTSFVAGDQYRFYVSYPFLRAANASAELCEDCHADRVMQHAALEGPNAGWATSYSHPVGEALGANGKGYDRAAPLDANGAAQSPGDDNPTNDLNVFGSAATVRCLTCHSPHNADSNSQTTDAR